MVRNFSGNTIGIEVKISTPLSIGVQQRGEELLSNGAGEGVGLSALQGVVCEVLLAVYPIPISPLSSIIEGYKLYL